MKYYQFLCNIVAIEASYNVTSDIALHERNHA